MRFLPSLLAALAILSPACWAQAQPADRAVLETASGPALLCPEQNQLYGFSSSWPDGRPLAPNREPVAFVMDGEEIYKVSINPQNAAEMLVDRLTPVVSAHNDAQQVGGRVPGHAVAHVEQVVALETGSSLVGVARLYAISFTREEVGSTWALSFQETQSGAVWWRCRAIAPSDLLG